MPTGMATFVQSTYVRATIVHISIISAVTDLILTKLFGSKFESCAQHYSPILQPPTHPPKYPPNHPPTVKVVNLVHLLDLYDHLISNFNC